jgi:hypothetical protein
MDKAMKANLRTAYKALAEAAKVRTPFPAGGVAFTLEECEKEIERMEEENKRLRKALDTARNIRLAEESECLYCDLGCDDVKCTCDENVERVKDLKQSLDALLKTLDKL